MKITGLLLFIFLSSSSGVYAQCCSGGVPISGALGLSSTQAQSWQFLLTYDFNAMNDLIEGNRILDKLRKRSTHSGLFEVNYGLSKRITLTGMLSFVRQERLVNTLDNRSDFTSTQGLGDGIFLVKFQLISGEKWPDYSFSIGLGPKIPIGRTNFTDRNGLALPADLQPGSGAWDVLFWSHFERRHMFIKNLNLIGALTYRYTGTNKHYFIVQKYRFGNELLFSLQTNYRFFIGTEMLDASTTILYRNQKTDLVDGEDFPNSGGRFLYAIPAFSYHFTPDISLRFSGYVPLHRDPDGTQLSTSYKLIASIGYTLRKKTF